MKYYGEIDGVKIYEENPEKKHDAIIRGMTIFMESQIRHEGEKTDEIKTA